MDAGLGGFFQKILSLYFKCPPEARKSVPGSVLRVSQHHQLTPTVAL